MRNRENYEEDLSLKNTYLTGIKEKRVFNDVPLFHIAVNFTVDLMHDVFEGVCVYVLRAILYEFIFVKQYFTLQTLNERIRNFNYSSEDSNRPPVINKNRFKDKLNMKFSTSEMSCLVRYLGS